MSKKNIYYRDFNAQRYSQSWRITPAEQVRVDIILKLAGKNVKILDVGCYDGSIAEFLKRNGNKVFGIDSSLEAMKLTKAKGIDCIKGDINEEITFIRDNSFDIVLAAEVIEHVLNPGDFIEQAKRILKKGGTLILTTPNLASLGRRLYLLFGRNPLIEIGIDDGEAGHIRYFVKDTLCGLLKKYDFAIKVFCSDVVNFDNSGNHFFKLLAKVFPGLGKTLIVKAVKQ